MARSTCVGCSDSARVGFGTKIGRLLTRFVVVPFGGAYVILAFLHHLWEWYTALAGAGASAGATSGPDAAGTSFHSTAFLVQVLPLGLFFLGLINSAGFKRFVGQFFRIAFRLLRAATIEPVRWVIQSPWLQRIIRSRLFALGLRFVVKPLLWTAVAWFLFARHESNRQISAITGGVMFLAFNVLLNSRLGRNAEEATADWLVQSWHHFGVRFLAGIFWFLIDVFRAVVETMERLIYSVDEWLRFRSGESRTTLAVKALLGLPWSLAAYVLRFAINVLIEPQINPIKHFPVVTVSHKLLLPAYKPFADLLELRMGMGSFSAWLVAGTTIWCVPGIFGFLVWELKENWRLYAANRRPKLSPVRIGSHGENMGRLLRPGFHSGTLPKRFAKLRRAERRRGPAAPGRRSTSTSAPCGTPN